MSSDPGRGARRPPTDVTRGGYTEETDAVPVGVVFDALAAETRRHLLYFLAEEAGGEATPSELADRLGSIDARYDQTDVQAILVGLHHRHLPKLSEAGLVEYEGRGEPVRYLGDPLVEKCLAMVAVRDVGREP